ncbi:MAG TPA: hypothetical protein ENF44_03225, partial [Deltaproteobacteria bacterium]|nr:hypothetical protein [Deltaproteobacteria bacterium]
MKKAFVVGIVILLVLPLPGKGKGIVYIDIDSASIRLYRLAFPPLTLLRGVDRWGIGKRAEAIIWKDLEIAHLFHLMDRSGFPQKGYLQERLIKYDLWRDRGAEFLLSVGYGVGGEKVFFEFRLYDVVRGRYIG